MAKKKIKHAGLQIKVIVGLSFVLLVLILFLVNRMGGVNFVPHDISEEPWALSQSCEAPIAPK